jgi:hypothetical protein
MTAAPNPFAGPDADLVSAIAAEIGAGFVAGYSPIAVRHISDPRISTATLMAAVAQAHTAGLVKAIRTAAGGDVRQFVAEIAAWIDAEVARP